LFILLAALFLFHQTAHSQAQRGAIIGTVKDKGSNETLPGANLVLEGTTLGAASDLEGRYVIRNVPAGTYSLRATVIGYLPSVVSGVKVAAHDTVRLNFSLSQTAIDVPEVVVTASRKAQSFLETPASVSVVGSQRIQEQNFATVDRLLEFIPGVNMMSGQINVRGSSGYSRGAGSRVLLLVDGVPMLPGDSGDIKWDALPPNEVDHVEVVKGAASSLYGSNALGGVINVITKEPSANPMTAIRTTAGVYDEPYYDEWKWTERTLSYNYQDISHSRAIGNLKVRGSLGRRESTGFQQNGHYHRFSGYLKAKHNFSSTSYLTAYGNYARDRHGDIIAWKSENDPYEVADDATGDATLSKKLQLGATYRTLLRQKMTLQLRNAYYTNGFDNRLADATANPFCTTHGDTIRVRAYKNDFEAQLDYEWSAKHATTFGAAATLNFIDATLYGEHDGRAAAGYAQHEWRPNPVFTATGSLRFDYNYVDTGLKEYHLNPRLGLVYQLSPRSSLRASAGRGFRAATMAEMFTCTRVGGFTVIPNPNLGSEAAWSYEVGGQFVLNNLLVNGAIFWNDYEDLIEGDFVTKRSVSVIQFQNFNQARIRGAELEVNGSFWNRRVNFGLSYTYLDARELERRNSQTGVLEALDEPLAYRAKDLLTGNVSLKLGKFSFGADSRYVGRIQRVRVYEDDVRVSQKVTNLRAGWRTSPVEVTLNAYNIFQYNYTQVERNLEAPRSVALTTALAF
jgi:iron complex outermembrane receptor protein